MKVPIYRSLPSENDISRKKYVCAQTIDRRLVNELELLRSQIADADVPNIDDGNAVSNVVACLKLSAKWPGLN